MEQTKVAAAVISALSEEQQQTAFDCGRRMAESELEAVATAETFARMLGPLPTYDEWENGRVKWIAGHAAGNPKLTGNAHDKAWEKFSGNLNTLFGLVKPSSKSVAAVKKREERAAKDDALLKQHENATPDQLRQQLEKAFATLAKNPENKAAEKLTKDLKKVLKVKTADQVKAQNEQLAALRKEINEAAKKCTHVLTLEAARDIITEAADFEYAEETERNSMH